MEVSGLVAIVPGFFFCTVYIWWWRGLWDSFADGVRAELEAAYVICVGFFSGVFSDILA